MLKVLLKKVKELNCTLHDDGGRTGEIIINDSRSHVIKDMLNSLSYGVEDCIDTNCYWCKEKEK